MTRHQKRLSVPKSWPVERKTETFTVKADAGPHGEAGVPLLVLLRDVLGYVDSRKEARYALGQSSVLVNGKPVSDEGRPIGMFDIVAFTEREEYYRVFPDEGGRLALTPIEADSADSKLGKVVGKRQVPGGAFQLTMHDGATVQVEEAGTYPVQASVASANGGGSFHLVIDDDRTTETVSFDPTGGWQSFSTISAGEVELSEGEHVIRLVAEAPEWNVKWLQLGDTGGQGTPTPSPTTTESTTEVTTTAATTTTAANTTGTSTTTSGSGPGFGLLGTVAGATILGIARLLSEPDSEE